MTHASFFTGECGFDIAAEWAGFKNEFGCEINEFCRKVYEFYWPGNKLYGNIKDNEYTIWRGRIDIVTGGFPCQPFSTAGEQLGEQDERFLWQEMLRAVCEIKPRWVVAENVRGLTSGKFERTFEQICSSLETEGYKVQPIIIPATSVGAEHERYRVWIIAHSPSIRLSGQGTLLGRMQPTKIGDRETSGFVNFIQGNSMPYVCKSHDGFSRRLAEEALHAAGNAIVPQIAYQIFETIKQYELTLTDRP